MPTTALYSSNYFATPFVPTLAQADGSGIGVIVFLVFVGLFMIALVIFTVVVIVISAKRRGDRTAKLKVVAQQLGFYFTPKPAMPNFLCNTRFAQWYPAVGTGIHNMLQGVAGERPVLVFDFGYTRTMGGYGSATYRETVMCVPCGAAPAYIFFRERTLVPPESIQAWPLP